MHEVVDLKQRCQTWMQRHPERSSAWLFYHPSAAYAAQWIRDLMHRDICTAEQSHRPCGICSRCVWFQENAHPDIHHVGLTATQCLIGIEAMRQLQARLSRKRHSHTRHLVYISDAHALSHAAANGLLKMLEEPVSPTVFMLHASDEATLLQTIKSRCFQITLPQRHPGNETLPMPDIQSGETTDKMRFCWHRLSQLKTCHTWDASDSEMLNSAMRWVASWLAQQWPMTKEDHPHFTLQVDFLMLCLRDLHLRDACTHGASSSYEDRRLHYDLLLGIKADFQKHVQLNIGMLHATLLPHLPAWHAYVADCLRSHASMEKNHD